MMICSSRISQQVRECNPRQFGIGCCSGSSCFSGGRAPQRQIRRYAFWFRCRNTACFTRFNPLTKGVPYAAVASYSLVASNSDEIPVLCFGNSDGCRKYSSETPAGPDVNSLAENGGCPASGLSPVAGGIVALGKFDALHIGHRELAIHAANIGIPFLLSFAGIAQVLGWAPRVPIVAECDRQRVLSSWTPFCGNMTPKEFPLEFSSVRYLTPQQFVAKLAEELGVGGVVAGENYRFGYKASGNASDLVRLCNEYGMIARVIDCVMDKNQDRSRTLTSSSKEQGQVSSTQVRHALAIGDMKYVSELLGRPHRLVVRYEDAFMDGKRRLFVPRSCFLNLPPKDGVYKQCSLIIGDGDTLPCRADIDAKCIALELDANKVYPDIISTHSVHILAIDFEG